VCFASSSKAHNLDGEHRVGVQSGHTSLFCCHHERGLKQQTPHANGGGLTLGVIVLFIQSHSPWSCLVMARPTSGCHRLGCARCECEWCECECECECECVRSRYNSAVRWRPFRPRCGYSICTHTSASRELLSANKHAYTRVCDVNRQGCMGRNSARIYTFGCWCGDARTCRERRVNTRISYLANCEKRCVFVCVQVSCVENEHGSQHARGVVSRAWAAGSLSGGWGRGWTGQQENQTQKKLQYLLKRWLRQAIVQGSSLSTAM
jgi:hypothetical protein